MEQTLETKTLDRMPCRSDPFQAPIPEIEPAMLGCWVARLSIRQRSSGATPCEVGAQAHICGVFDVRQIVEEISLIEA